MSIFELSKDHYYWKSPITKIYGDIQNDIVRQDEENYMCAITQAIGYRVDKEELIRALQYDREQYNKGYRDGVKEKFIEELEKLKSEIKDEEYSTNWLVSADVEKGWNEAVEYAIGKIDYYIKEMKGEAE